LQGGSDELIEHLSRGEVPSGLPAAERALLDFAGLLTRSSWRTRREDVQRLRDAGWSEQQIAEAVYITALFAFYNRVADAFGLTDPGYRQLGGIPDPGIPAPPGLPT
jgi:alkylhydroperoxidase family enzyme